MNTVVNIFAWIGRVSVMIAIWIVLFVFIHLVVMPVYTRQGSEIKVPEVTGKSLHDAQAIYKKKGFEIVVDNERFDATAPKDLILDQFPPAGGWTKKGRRIHVWISAGPPMSTVPYLIGQSFEDASFAVQNAGLEVGEITFAFSDSLFEGLVLDQLPVSGEEVSRDSTVSYVVSLGKQPSEFIVPQLENMPQEKAVYLAQKAGLVVGEIIYDRYLKRKDGAVILQDLKPGKHFALGDTITLVVNQRWGEIVKKEDKDKKDNKEDE